MKLTDWLYLRRLMSEGKYSEVMQIINDYIQEMKSNRSQP